jgi:hypothetical protein
MGRAPAAFTAALLDREKGLIDRSGQAMFNDDEQAMGIRHEAGGADWEV